jgi:hypothetical protein
MEWAMARRRLSSEESCQLRQLQCLSKGPLAKATSLRVAEVPLVCSAQVTPASVVCTILPAWPTRPKVHCICYWEIKALNA